MTTTKTTDLMELADRLTNMTIAEELALPVDERCAMIRAWHAVQGDNAVATRALCRDGAVQVRVDGDDPCLSDVSELGNAW